MSSARVPVFFSGQTSPSLPGEPADDGETVWPTGHRRLLEHAQVVLWIARLGGYLNRKHDRPPGPTVIWRGFLSLHEITEMYQIFGQNE
jgi:hypothetical protein